jgi:inosose dehydratase
MSINTRREVLRAFGAVAACAHMRSHAQAPAAGIHLGAQTNAYPIDPKDFETFLSAIGKLKTIGYQGFETGYRNVMPQFAAPTEARAKIAATGLTFFGIHIFLQHAMYDPTTLIAPPSLYEQVAQGGKSLGALNLVCSGAAAETTGQLNAKIAGLNAAAKFCHDQGIGFAYHNEEPESASKLNELDILYTRTDPATVRFLLDVGHLYNLDGDVVAFIRKHHDRIVGLHLRDYKDHKQVVLGSGTLPLHDIAHTLEQLHWRGWVECEEERLDGVKHGDEYLSPAFSALKEAFSK